MRIIEYSSLHGTQKRNGYFAVTEFDRITPSTRQFTDLAGLNITLTKPTAFLYIDGVSFTASDAGIGTNAVSPTTAVIKTTSSYSTHCWVRTFKGNEHLVKVDTISSTCAAGIQALYEANKLLESGEVEEVIVIGCERISDATLKLFSELCIPITCGDGFVFMRLAKGDGISDIKWKYRYNSNPFMFTKDTLDELTPSYPVDYVKLHATGTGANESAEEGLRKLGHNLRYKDLIGHTQGVSSLVETCMVLDDDSIQGKILVVANGLGGFYGSFTLDKAVSSC